MAYTFQHRYVPGHEATLKPGRYTATSDWYEVDRSPRVGEACTAYIAHARQCGRLIRTTYDSFTVDR